MAARDSDDDKDLGTLKEDIARLREDLASVKSTLATLGKRSAAQAKAAGSAKVDELQDEIERIMDDLQLRGRDTLAGVEKTVHERPLTSLLAAFGLGFLISRFLDRR